MAEKLSVQIELEGGAYIAKQLEGIGKAGQQAFADIAKSAEQVGGFKNIKPDEVTAKLKDMGVTGVDSIEKIQKAVQAAGRLETLVQGIQAAETALKTLAIAAVPVGAAIAGAMVAATKATISFAESITKVSEQAMKIGQSIEQFDRMRRALEGAGVSTQNVAGFMQRLGAAAAAADLDRVAKAVKEIQAAMARGAGAGTIADTAQWRTLQEEATKATEAGKRAREALVEVGAPIPSGAALTFGELVTKTGNAEAGLKAFVEQLRQMPNSVEANKAAMDALGVSATQLITAYDNLAAKGTGAITPDMVTKAGEVTEAVNRMQAAFDRLGTVSFAPVVVAELNAITGALQALQAAINNFSWETFKNGAIAAGNALGWLTPSGLATKAFAAALGEVGPAAEQAGQAAAAAGQQAAAGGQQAVSGWDAFLAKLDEIARKAGAILGGGGGGGGGAPAMAGGGLLGGRGSGTSDSNLAWLSRGEFVVQAAAVRKYGAGLFAALNAQRFADGGLVGGGGTETITVSVNNMVQAIETNTEAIKSQSEVIMQLGQIISNMVQTVSSALSGSGRARGGLLGGRGTGTSDSNLAWVSRGEHIMPARAVAQPGVLSFLEALRRSGGNLSRVLDGMGRFALGGMIPRMAAFAGGGPVGSMSHVTIAFPGLPAIGGLRASSGVVDQLHKAAALAQVRSGGRKPSRYS